MTSEHCIVMTTTADEDGAATRCHWDGRCDVLCRPEVSALADRASSRQEGSAEGGHQPGWVRVAHDATNDDAEHLLLVKTRSALYAELEGFIREHHPYDVPEIVQVPITAGFGPYLGWIDEMTAPPPA